MAASNPAAIEAEENLLGSILITPAHLTGVLAELGLSADHFYLDRHRLIFRALVSMYDTGKPIDEITAAAELERRGDLAQAGGRDRLTELTATVGAPSHAFHYAERILEKAEWRLRVEAANRILAAAANEDREELANAEELLNREVKRAGADFSPGQLADIGFALLEGGGAECFPWPLERLNDLTAGGIRRGEFVVIGGHSSHGKSVLADQLLEAGVRRGAKARLYINEMALEERVARMLNRRTGVPYSRIIRGKPKDGELSRLLAELGRGMPFGITYVPGWSAEEIGHHVRRSRWDIALVDILHEIDHEDESDLRRIVSTFARTAKQADCAMIATAHLSEARVKGIVRPRPTLGDLRGSGHIKNAADTVCFVYREQHPQTGELLDGASVYLSKVRNGRLGGLKCRFNGARLRFQLPDEAEVESPISVSAVGA